MSCQFVPNILHVCFILFSYTCNAVISYDMLCSDILSMVSIFCAVPPPTLYIFLSFPFIPYFPFTHYFSATTLVSHHLLFSFSLLSLLLLSFLTFISHPLYFLILFLLPCCIRSRICFYCIYLLSWTRC